MGLLKWSFYGNSGTLVKSVKNVTAFLDGAFCQTNS